MAKTDRIYKIELLIRHRGQVSFAQLLETLEVSPATLKRDLNWIYGKKHWRSRDLLRSAIFDYIEGFYNPQRIQKRLGYRSPADFESAAVA